MPAKSLDIKSIKGINEADVELLQEKFGKNIVKIRHNRGLLNTLKDFAGNPMFILLLIASCLYFMLGKVNEGIMMGVGILFVSGISIYQQTRSTHALEALRRYSEPKVIVIREGLEKIIESADLVPGDVILLFEGNKVPADATILKQNDLTIDESIITGESLPVEKDDAATNNLLYQGSTINTGQCYARVTAIGSNTTLGRLGKTITAYKSPKTLLQHQLDRFVKQFSFFWIFRLFRHLVGELFP